MTRTELVDEKWLHVGLCLVRGIVKRKVIIRRCRDFKTVNQLC